MCEYQEMERPVEREVWEVERVHQFVPLSFDICPEIPLSLSPFSPLTLPL